MRNVAFPGGTVEAEQSGTTTHPLAIIVLGVKSPLQLGLSKPLYQQSPAGRTTLAINMCVVHHKPATGGQGMVQHLDWSIQQAYSG